MNFDTNLEKKSYNEDADEKDETSHAKISSRRNRSVIEIIDIFADIAGES